MPIPIHNPNQEQNTNIDYSFLLKRVDDASKRTVTASNRDADLLMDIWKLGNKKDNTTFDVKELDLTQRDLMRLKQIGLVAGNKQELVLTEKGKNIIKTMTLGESNRFGMERKQKSYTEIMASISKKGKSGFRIASNPYATDNTNQIDLREKE